MTKILEVKNIFKSFDGIQTIKNISFTVNKQDIILISGENGAGKSTLFNLITGLEKIADGIIVYNNVNVSSLSIIEISGIGIIRLYQQPRLFKNLLVWENLVVAAKQNESTNFFNIIFKLRAVKKEEEQLRQKSVALLARFGLQHLSGQTVGELSYGQQKLISFCMIIMNDAQLVLLDEPFAGLNPQTIGHFSNMITQMNKEGVTFLIIEHNTEKVLEIANRHLEMKDGEISAIISVENEGKITT